MTIGRHSEGRNPKRWSRPAFTNEDWSAISALLSWDPEPASRAKLEEALTRLEEALRGEYLSADECTNALLDSWPAARAVGLACARPIERLLSSLPQRLVVTRNEILDLTSEIRAALELAPRPAHPA